MSWFDNNIQKTHGPRISKEMAEALGVFRFCDTGLKRKPDGSLQVLFNADTPKDVSKDKVCRHIQVEEVDGQIVFVHQSGEKVTFGDPEAARQYLNEQLGENCKFQRNGTGYLASRSE